MKFTEKTPELLRLYLGLDHGRGIKKTVLFDELIRRGVSVHAVVEAIDRMVFAIGWAADNRIPEIDDQLEGNADGNE